MHRRVVFIFVGTQLVFKASALVSAAKFHTAVIFASLRFHVEWSSH